MSWFGGRKYCFSSALVNRSHSCSPLTILNNNINHGFTSALIKVYFDLKFNNLCIGRKFVCNCFDINSFGYLLCKRIYIYIYIYLFWFLKFWYFSLSYATLNRIDLNFEKCYNSFLLNIWWTCSVSSRVCLYFRLCLQCSIVTRGE